MVYPGWTMAFVAFMTFALTIGPAGSTMPLIYSGVVADFGWSLTEAMLVYTYKNVASAVATLVFIGPLVARFGEIEGQAGLGRRAGRRRDRRGRRDGRGCDRFVGRCRGRDAGGRAGAEAAARQQDDEHWRRQATHRGHDRSSSSGSRFRIA